MMQRREFLLRGSATAGLGLLPIGRSAWAAVSNPPSVQGRRLVVVFLRGAVDGLSVVAPVHEAAYGAARSTIALARPGTEGGALDLDGRFGLHPALAPLMPLWQGGKLGFVHAAGSHDATRSHFDAQDYMESATPGRKSTPDGWLNRLLGVLPAPELRRDRVAARPDAGATTRAVSLGAVLPRIYAGEHPVANVPLGAAATRPTALDRPAVGQAFDRLYAGDDALARAYHAAQRARRDVRDALEGDEAMAREMVAANNGAPLPNGFPADAVRLATLMRNDARVQLAFVALGGWDTHAGQGAATGQLANRLAPLGLGLAQFAQVLGPAFDDTVVLVVSEFGRTARENGTGGTDHGHGNVMWLLGGKVAGGRVHGRWPGIDDAALHESRDLAITTDFRTVLAQVLERHLRLSDPQLHVVLPQWTPPADALAPLIG